MLQDRLDREGGPSALEDAVASGQAFLKNQVRKLDKKPVLQQRLSDLGVLDEKDPA